MAIVQMLIIAQHIKDGVEAVGDKVHVAIEDGKVVKVTPMETLSTHYKRPSRLIAIRKPSPSSLALSDRLGGCPSFPGEFGAADLDVSASVNSSAAAIFASASPPGGSVESLLQALSFPSTAMAPPLAVAAAARRPTHRTRHSVERRQRLVTSRLDLLSVLALSLAESHCAGTACAAGRGAGPMCRGGAVPMTAALGETVTHSCPSRSRASCLALLRRAR
ncbi:hypothetical protein EDB85DRAFT_368396 [Lactarius pseudohatsudake]|nr:hypothetical protein EDB85DRAFT_368396 [Lactarius pseudohatsudake]